jgi:hypothetical protein
MAIESNGLDAMFIFTVSMGLIAAFMAWIITVIAIKGWAVRTAQNFSYAYRPVAAGSV